MKYRKKDIIISSPRTNHFKSFWFKYRRSTIFFSRWIGYTFWFHTLWVEEIKRLKIGTKRIWEWFTFSNVHLYAQEWVISFGVILINQLRLSLFCAWKQNVVTRWYWLIFNKSWFSDWISLNICYKIYYCFPAAFKVLQWFNKWNA